MPVPDNVHNPPRTKHIDPKDVVDKKPQDVLDLKNEVEKARARRELVQETRITEQMMNPPPPEQPFKMTGEFNLGKIDFQEQQRLAREESDKVRKDAEISLEKTRKERDDAVKALQNAEMKHLQDMLLGRIDALQNAVASGQGKDVFAELEKIESAATKLGFVKSDPASTDMNATIALKRLEIEMKREDRRFQAEMKKDDRLWQIELKKLAQQEREAEARLQMEQKKWDAIASAPEVLGTYIAKGLVAKTEGGIAAPAGQQAPMPQQVQVTSVTAEEGEAGEINCPRCQTLVGIGPTSKQTACAKCRQPFVINRVPKSSEAEPEMDEEAKAEAEASKLRWP